MDVNLTLQPIKVMLVYVCCFLQKHFKLQNFRKRRNEFLSAIKFYVDDLSLERVSAMIAAVLAALTPRATLTILQVVHFKLSFEQRDENSNRFIEPLLPYLTEPPVTPTIRHRVRAVFARVFYHSSNA